jgi:hypothetical protein
MYNKVNIIFLERGTCYVAQAGIKLNIFLLQPPDCWDYRCASPHPARVNVVLFIEHFTNFCHP